MRTEADLRAALASLERLAPEPDAVLAGVEPQRHRHTVRRRTMLLAAAAATVTAIPLGSRLLLDRHRTAAVTGAPVHPWRFTFAVELDGDYQVYGMRRSEHRQEVTLVGPAGGAVDRMPMVVVHDVGALDAAEARTGEPVTIQGRPGYYVSRPLGSLPVGELAIGVFWEYAPDAWAVAVADIASNRKDRSVLLAEAVRFGRDVPLRVPYRVGQLPPGLRAAGGSWEAPVFGEATKRTSQVRLVSTTSGGAGLTLQAVPAADLHPSFPARDAPIGEPVTVAGAQESLVAVNYGSFGLTIILLGPGGPPGLAIEEVAAVARSITPTSDYQDLSAWFDAVTAIPAG